MDEILQKYNELNLRIAQLEKNNTPKMPDHFHNGFDASRVQWADLDQNRIQIWHTIYNTDAATAGNYGVFFISPASCYLSIFQEVHQTAGSDAGAVTVTLEKLTGTQAPDAGAEMLSAGLSLKATANTVQTGTITGTLANKRITKGDRLALKDAGVLTAVNNVTVFVELILT